MDEKKNKEKEEEKKRFYNSRDTRQRNIVVKEISDHTNQKNRAVIFFTTLKSIMSPVLVLVLL